MTFTNNYQEGIPRQSLSDIMHLCTFNGSEDIAQNTYKSFMKKEEIYTCQLEWNESFEQINISQKRM